MSEADEAGWLASLGSRKPSRGLPLLTILPPCVDGGDGDGMNSCSSSMSSDTHGARRGGTPDSERDGLRETPSFGMGAVLLRFLSLWSSLLGFFLLGVW